MKLIDTSTDNISWLQWSRFKRRERSIIVFVWFAILLHVIFWLLWHFLVAPYPIALTIPVSLGSGSWAWVNDYLWPLANTIILGLNFWLAFRVYKKDIFAGWIMLGSNIFLQFLVLSVTLYLISFSAPFL